MARCGCSSGTTCNCAVKAGANITVTGVGSAGNPYVISGLSATVAPLDTTTIDTTVTGGPNYVVSSKVIISPDAGNELVAHANGLYAPGPCISTDAGNELSFGTDGCLFAPADTALSNGPGIAPIVGGVVMACLSTDVGNSLVFGTDNCLFVAPGAVSCAAVAACFTTLDTNSVNLSPSGTLPLTADVIRDPEAGNILTIGAAGLDVNLNTGCGLSGDGTLASPLIVDMNAAVWPFACAQTNGAPVYCDPVSGGLHVDPKQDRLVVEADLTSTAGSMELNAIGVPIGGPPAVFGPTLTGTFTNPNPCRAMVVVVNGGVKHFNMRADTSGRLQFQYGLQLTLTGPAAGVYTPNGSHVQFMADGNRAVTDPNWDFIWDTVATTQFAQFTLPAGASFNYTLQGIAQLTNYNSDGQINTLMAFAHFDGQTI